MGYETIKQSQINSVNRAATAQNVTAVVSNDNHNPLEMFRNSLPEIPDFSGISEDINKAAIDIEKLYKKFKKNPAALIDSMNFLDDKTKKELKSVIKNKKDFKAFLNIVAHDQLTPDDVVAVMDRVEKKVHKGIKGTYKRAKNVFKKIINGDFLEAYDLAKSEKVHISKELSKNAEEIRIRRNDFSSEGLVEMADQFYEHEEIKMDAMHFIDKEEFAGKKLYTEADALTAITQMGAHPSKARAFRINAEELEGIKDENGHIKYKGSTIVDVGIKMTTYEEMKATMMGVARKRDMNDNYLLGITDNLVANPNMEAALNSFLGCKDKNGNDRFSAKNLFAQTESMVHKTVEQIKSYQTNTLDLTQHAKLSGDNIVNIAEDITQHPEIKNSVYQKIEDQNYSGNDVDKYSAQQSNRTTNYADVEPNSKNNSRNSSTNNVNSTENKTQVEVKTPAEVAREEYQAKVAEQRAHAANKYNTIVSSLQNIELDTKENYTKQEVSRLLYREYGSAGDEILKKLEENPKFIEVMKKYGNNREIIIAIIKNPNSIDKISGLSASMTTTQLASFVKLCTNSEKTETIAKLIKTFGPQKALSMAEKSETVSNKRNILDVLNKNTIKSDEKREIIEDTIIKNNNVSPLAA